MLLDLGTLLGAPLLGIIGEQFGYSALFGFASLLCLSTLFYVRHIPAPNESAAV
jgi:predicted MFS family arabinose efflux permease